MFGENSSFITLKDPKENVNNNSTGSVINPAKNELERFSKMISEKVNESIREAMSLNPPSIEQIMK